MVQLGKWCWPRPKTEQVLRNTPFLNLQPSVAQVPPDAPETPGLGVRFRLDKQAGEVCQIAWSPDGRTLAVPSVFGTVELRCAHSGMLKQTLGDHYAPVYSIDWSPDSKHVLTGSGIPDSAIRIWDAATGALLKKFSAGSVMVWSVAWSPDNRSIAYGCDDGSIHVIDPITGRKKRSFGEHCTSVDHVAWSPSGAMLTWWSTSEKKVWIWLTGSQEVLTRTDDIWCMAWAPQSNIFALGAADCTVRIWDSPTRRLTNILEGHTGPVASLSFSAGGRILASKSTDHSVRLWRTDTWETIASFEDRAGRLAKANVVFHPRLPRLATCDEEQGSLRIWDIDQKTLLMQEENVITYVDADEEVHVAESDCPVHYTNAKVVLVGDSGVGKTALGNRLATGDWQPTDGSTHGMNLWTLQDDPEREIMLWDFAGQPEYRMVHQLFLDQTALALLLYDPTKPESNFTGTEYWERTLDKAIGQEHAKMLVASRVDVGGVQMTQEEIDQYCQEHHFLDHHVTSARSNEGCPTLKERILAAIPWDSLPTTSSPEVFKHIKDFIGKVRQKKKVLIAEFQLYEQFCNQYCGEKPSPEQFGTVIQHVETAGLIQRTFFGDLILLKPELLNGIASDIIDAARKHPDGLGCVPIARVLSRGIQLNNDQDLSEQDQIYLLHSTVAAFLELGIALGQDDNLVFPSKFNRQMPPVPEDHDVELEYHFDGPIDNLYTTLVIKLYYGGAFKLKGLWKNAAEFTNDALQTFGFQLHTRGDGHGVVDVFFSNSFPIQDKILLIKAISSHFDSWNIQAKLQRVYRCTECGEPIRDTLALERALAANREQMPCLYCFEPISLGDEWAAMLESDSQVDAAVRAMEQMAQQRASRESSFVSATGELRSGQFKDWAGGTQITNISIVFTDIVDSSKLNCELGDATWSRVRDAHFAQAKHLLGKRNGYLIKTIGDGLLVAFRNSVDALAFAMALQANTGDELILIRAGVHIGQVQIESDDVYGQHVNLTARISAQGNHQSVMTSQRVKEDIKSYGFDIPLNWRKKENQKLKGFDRAFDLWEATPG